MAIEEKQKISYRIKIDSDVWTKFKKKTDKSMTMNERVCRLIYGVVDEKYPEDEKVGKQPSTKKTVKKVKES